MDVIRNPRRFSTLAISLFLMLVYPLLGMLWHHGYPAFSAEVLLTIAGFATLAIFLSLLLQSVRPVVRNMVLTMVVTLVFLVHFNLLFNGLIAVLAVGVVLSFVLGRHFTSTLLIVFAALITGAFIDNRLDRARNQTEMASRPDSDSGGSLIHILVDGFIGPDGLPDPEESLNLRMEMMAFFEEFDFEVHSRAYTHYAHTVDSMTRAFNFQNDNVNFFRKHTLLHEPLTVRENAWFRALKDHGYPIAVYQSELFDFCSPGPPLISYCNTFPFPNLRTVHSDVGGTGKRATILLRTLLRQSVIPNDLLMKFTGRWGVAAHDDRLVSKLIHDVRKAPGGAFFSHILIPHQPMVFRPDCSLDYESESWQRYPSFDGLIGNSDESRRIRYRRYAENAKCALSEVGRLLDSLRETGLYDQATIVLHGDHGGPLYQYGPFVQNAKRLSLRDLRETYSTLFAVKYPGGSFSVNEEMMSLNVLMAQTLGRITGKSGEELGIEVTQESEPFIYLSNDDPMPRINVNFFNE